MKMSELQALIAPSILASDFSRVGAECSRMIRKEGADWLHLGPLSELSLLFR